MWQQYRSLSNLSGALEYVMVEQETRNEGRLLLVIETSTVYLLLGGFRLHMSSLAPTPMCCQ